MLWGLFTAMGNSYDWRSVDAHVVSRVLAFARVAESVLEVDYELGC